MKNGFQKIIIIITIAFISCHKDDDNTSSTKLSLLQHKWNLISRNGEVLRYVGTDSDYYNFAQDDVLYRNVAKNHDTSYYKLSPANDSILLLYPVINGFKSDSATSYYIHNLTVTQLVVSIGAISPPVTLTDSLKR